MGIKDSALRLRLVIKLSSKFVCFNQAISLKRAENEKTTKDFGSTKKY